MGVALSELLFLGIRLEEKSAFHNVILTRIEAVPDFCAQGVATTEVYGSSLKFLTFSNLRVNDLASVYLVQSGSGYHHGRVELLQRYPAGNEQPGPKQSMGIGQHHASQTGSRRFVYDRSEVGDLSLDGWKLVACRNPDPLVLSHFRKIALIDFQIGPYRFGIGYDVGIFPGVEAFSLGDVKLDNGAAYGGFQFERSQRLIAFHFSQEIPGLDKLAQAPVDGGDNAIETRSDVGHGSFVYADFAGQCEFIPNCAAPRLCDTYAKIVHILPIQLDPGSVAVIGHAFKGSRGLFHGNPGGVSGQIGGFIFWSIFLIHLVVAIMGLGREDGNPSNDRGN